MLGLGIETKQNLYRLQNEKEIPLHKRLNIKVSLPSTTDAPDVMTISSPNGINTRHSSAWAPTDESFQFCGKATEHVHKFIDATECSVETFRELDLRARAFLDCIGDGLSTLQMEGLVQYFSDLMCSGLFSYFMFSA